MRARAGISRGWVPVFKRIRLLEKQGRAFVAERPKAHLESEGSNGRGGEEKFRFVVLEDFGRNIGLPVAAVKSLLAQLAIKPVEIDGREYVPEPLASEALRTRWRRRR